MSKEVLLVTGAGVTISSQSGWRMPQLTPTEDLLKLDFLQPDKIENTLKAYQLAKRCNEKRVMYEAVEWGNRGARTCLRSARPAAPAPPMRLPMSRSSL